MSLPVGREAIFEFYGFDPKVYIDIDGQPKPSWERDMMQRFLLPEPMILSWDRSIHIGKITLHRKAGPFITAWLEDVSKAGLWSVVEVYGGGYAWRVQRGSDKLSMHALGAAIDLDPQKNQLGKRPEDTNFGGSQEGQAVVSIAEKRGLTWGGRWKPRPDAMHFQAGSGV